MGSVILVSGCPGSGKTTLSRALAAADPLGVHFVSDVFYEFLSHGIDPATPASREQNHTIMRALGAAAGEFAKGGYRVCLDGVIGPWMLGQLRARLEGVCPVHYVVLRLPEAEAIRRVAERQGPGLSPTVRHMHGQFADLGAFEDHAVDVVGLGPEAVIERVSRLLAAGRLEFDWAQVAG